MIARWAKDTQIPKSGNRFSEKIMLNKTLKRGGDST
jgi:hypothetical protein